MIVFAVVTTLSVVGLLAFFGLGLMFSRTYSAAVALVFALMGALCFATGPGAVSYAVLAGFDLVFAGVFGLVALAAGEN